MVTCLRARGFAAAAVGLTTFATAVSAAPARDGAAPPWVTIEAAIESPPPHPSRLRWLGDGHLMAQMNGRGREATAIAINIVNGAVRNVDRGGLSTPSPDGRHIARHRNGVLEIIRIDGQLVRSVEFAVETPANARLLPGAPVWSPDSSLAAVGAIIWPDDGASPQPLPGNADIRIVDIGASIDARPRMSSALMVVDLRSPDTLPARLMIEGAVRAFAFDHAGRVLFARARYWDYPEGERRTPIFRWDPGEAAPVEICAAPGVMQSMYPALSPDGRMLALGRDADVEIWEDFVTLSLVDLESGRSRRLAPDLRLSNLSGDTPVVWSRAGDRLFVLARRGAFDDVIALALDGGRKVLVRDDVRRFDLQISPSGDFLSYLTLDVYGRREARILELASGEERVVALFDDPASRFAMGRVDQIDWSNGEGRRIFGLVFYPPDFDADRRYPMLVDVHGGGPGSRLDLIAPFTRSVAPGPLEWHALAALGFLVFAPDYRSTGSYGASLVQSRYRSRDFAGIAGDVRDVESGVRALMKSSYVDKSRIAIRGHSAGAARANLLLTKTDIFAAAILNEMIDGGALATLIRFTTGENAGRPFEDAFFRAMLGAGLADAPDAYAKDFLFDGYKIETPTLIMTGGEGAASPLSSETLFSVLREYGTPARMLRFVDQGHTYANPAAVKAAFDAMLLWLEEHAPPRSTTPGRRAPCYGPADC